MRRMICKLFESLEHNDPDTDHGSNRNVILTSSWVEFYNPIVVGFLYLNNQLLYEEGEGMDH